MLFQAVKNIYKRFNTANVFASDAGTKPLAEQKEYVASFPEPADDFERSYFKYKCFCEFCYYRKKWIIFFYNFGAMIVLPFLRLSLRSKFKKHVPSLLKFDAAVENVPRLPNTDFIPESFTEEYPSIKEITEIRYGDAFLNDQADRICIELRKRYFRHFYFRIIVMMKLAQFSLYLEEYHPRAIAFYSCEREFAGPLLTLLCESAGSKYVVFMHGDYLYQLCFAFQRYSKYYLWDESYIEMFRSLHCSFPTEVYLPLKMRGIAQKLPPQDCRFFATYYFSAETREAAEKIAQVFKSFANAHLRCKIRPHPRFSDIKMLREVFDGFFIEDPKEYLLSDSITDSLYAIGLNTTVLSQAFFSGKDVVIDDISSPELYSSLEEREYIMMRRKHLLLSELEKAVLSDVKYDPSYLFFVNE